MTFLPGSRKALLGLLGAATWATLNGSAAHAFTLTPMTIDFDPSGPGATKSFELNNDGPEPIAVELSIARREMDLDGKEEQRKDPELAKRFLVYPPQLALKPKERRIVRVSYTGPADLKQEEAFRLIAEQLPVQTAETPSAKGAVIKMLLKYVAALYITPPKSKPELKVKEAKLEPAKGAKEPPVLRLTLENRGNAHRVLSGIHLKLTNPRGTVTLGPNELGSLSGQNVLAGTSRRFTLPWPTGLAKAQLTGAELEFKE